MNKPLPTDALLESIKQRFYDGHPIQQHFHRDRRMLLHALTWPAAWLDQRALLMSHTRYESILRQRLNDIARHGDPATYQVYFPRYLLKAIQDWFAWHGEDLYNELKHIRNRLLNFDLLLLAIQTKPAPDVVTPMAQVHAILNERHCRKKRPEPKQLTLF